MISTVRRFLLGLGVATLALSLVRGPALGAEGDRLGPPIPAEILNAGKKKAQPAPSARGDSQASKGSFAPVLPPKNYQPPSLQLSEETFNYGTVFKGEVITHRFGITNSGGSDLIISKVKPGCGCTKGEHDRLIPPGGKGGFTLKIDTGRLRPGKQKKWADVHSNDPQNLRKRVYLEGNIVTAFTVVPALPRLEMVRGEEDAKLEVTLEKAANIPFKITDVKALNNRVTTKLIEKEPGRLYTLEIRPNDDANTKTTYFSDRVVVDVEGNGKKMSQDIPVTIRLKNRISVKPLRTVYFRRPEVQSLRTSGEPVTKEVIVKSEVTQGDHQFQVTKVDLTDDSFEAKITPVREGKEYKVEVQVKSLPSDPTLKSLKSDMIIHTDDPSQPKIEMRVLAFI